MRGSVDEGLKSCLDACKSGGMNDEQMSERIDEWMSERTDEWMSERIDE